jgi:Uncharacterised nucleotidyltransferase
MKPAMQPLLEILRGELSDRALDEEACAAALLLAEKEHLMPWVAACLRLHQTSLPPAIFNRIDQIQRDAAVAGFYWSSELRGVLRALACSEIRAIPLKGPLLAERLYGNASLRVSRDLDVLVPKADLSRAEAVLAASGFAPGPSDDYHCPWRRQTTTLELHHDVENPLAFDFHAEGAFLRARPALFQEEPCWQLSPEDELLFLCLHAARHRYERLSIVLDLQLAFEKLPAAANGWSPRLEVAGLHDLLALGLAMARRLKPNLSVKPEVAESIPQNPRLEQLANRLWHQLLMSSSQSLDWNAVHAFFLEIESPGWPRFRRRVRHLRILSCRVIEPDYTFAGRFGLQHTWQVRMLRPLRLLSDFIRH